MLVHTGPMPTIQCPNGHDVEVEDADLVYEYKTGGKHVSTTMTKDKTLHVCDRCGMFTRDKDGNVAMPTPSSSK